jgi:hypothetical protein
MNAPAKNLLKVSSILMIIFGAIATGVTIISLAGSAGEASRLGGFTGIIIATIILIAVGSALELTAGIIGLKKYSDPTRRRYFILSGMILCVLSLASLIVSIADGSFTFFILGIPTGVLKSIAFMLPILFIIGGAMNRKAVQPAQHSK